MKITVIYNYICIYKKKLYITREEEEKKQDIFLPHVRFEPLKC